MLLVQLSEVSKSYGSHDVLSDVHWQLTDKARVALVGRNGAGKTTLFRMLTGESEPDTGRVTIRRGAVVAAMEQEVEVNDDRTLRAEAARGLQHIEELEAEFVTVTERLGKLTEDDPGGEALLERYGYLQERLEQENVYAFEARVKEVLTGLHFGDEDLDRPLATFSGGQKSRAALARVLLRDPDLLLLDEPTNHLDLAAIEWLENFLQGYGGAFVLISHDRTFVNRLAREVAELRHHRMHNFTGNYDEFLVERERRLEEQARKYELQREEIARKEDFIRKNIAGQKTKQAQARRKSLEKMERIEAPEWPASSIHMRLPEPSRTARQVFEAKDLAKNYGAVDVFRDVSFLVQRGQKVGVIGPNGVGKTTLLRILVGQDGQTSGTLNVGPGVQVGYFEQEQAGLRGTTSVLDELWSVTPQATETEIRTFLGAFLFRGDEVFKPLSTLSGGERCRVALAKLVREGANVLVLDEPTNHLDIESREVIEAAIEAFTGTVVAVSHDRFFLDRVVDLVLEVKPDGAKLWEGGYAQWARAHAAAGEAAKTQAPVEPPAGKRTVQSESASKPTPEEAPEDAGLSYAERKQRNRRRERLRREVADAEKRIGKLEARKEALELEMADPALATEAGRLGDLTRQIQALDREIAGTIAAWEEATVKLEAALDSPNS